MKAITVRLPDEVWKRCVHRLVDEELTWQGLIEPLMSRYAEGDTIAAQPAEAPASPADDKKPRPKARH